MSTISLCMIVKNEQAVLERCLSSVADLVDEIIIVDTGSTDETKAIAALYTDKVYDFEWIDDFAAARNHSLDLASMDYILWLDADDVLEEIDRVQFRELKLALNPSIHMVMMRYHVAFDAAGNPTFSYYRERLLRRDQGYRFEGAIHEAIPPRGNVVYTEIAVTHRKIGRGDPDRNLRIFEGMRAKGQTLTPRQSYYYGRELYYHAAYQKSAQALEDFLLQGQGWRENNIEACQILAYCYYALEQPELALRTLMRSFVYDQPRAELCCDIGKHFLDREDYRQSIFWYTLASTRPLDTGRGGFVQLDCYGYLPHLQLCVCYDRLGDRRRAIAHNERAGRIKPGDALVERNREYFNASAPAPQTP